MISSHRKFCAQVWIPFRSQLLQAMYAQYAMWLTRFGKEKWYPRIKTFVEMSVCLLVGGHKRTVDWATSTGPSECWLRWSYECESSRRNLQEQNGSLSKLFAGKETNEWGSHDLVSYGRKWIIRFIIGSQAMDGEFGGITLQLQIAVDCVWVWWANWLV